MYNLSHLTVTVVEDNRHMLTLFTEILRGLQIGGVRGYIDPADALSSLALDQPDLIITDQVMEPITGVELIRFIRQADDSLDHCLPVIMVSGRGDYETVTAARDIGATEFMVKPISAGGLYKRILEVINNPRPYIRAKGFFGPDRRRRDEEISFEDRRKRDAKEAESYAGDA